LPGQSQGDYLGDKILSNKYISIIMMLSTITLVLLLSSPIVLLTCFAKFHPNQICLKSTFFLKIYRHLGQHMKMILATSSCIVSAPCSAFLINFVKSMVKTENFSLISSPTTLCAR
jgi:hypothetical protein